MFRVLSRYRCGWRLDYAVLALEGQLHGMSGVGAGGYVRAGGRLLRSRRVRLRAPLA